MARSEVPIIAFRDDGKPAASATVAIYVRGGSLATVYTTEGGGATVTNPVAANVQGRIEGWLDRGAYTAMISGSGITTYQWDFDAIPGRDGSVDSGWLADLSVTSAKIQDAAVTSTKIADNSVSTVKIQDAAVTATKIADGAVTTAKLVDGAVTIAKLAPDVTFGSGNFGFPFTIDPRTTSGFLSFGTNIHYARVYGSGVITKLAVHVGVAAGNICVGIYSNSGAGRNAVPATRQRASSVIPCPAAGYAEISIGSAYTVVDGQAWFAIGGDNATATFLCPNIAFDSDLPKGLSAQATGGVTLPTTAASLDWLIRTPIIVGVA